MVGMWVAWLAEENIPMGCFQTLGQVKSIYIIYGIELFSPILKAFFSRSFKGKIRHTKQSPFIFSVFTVVGILGKVHNRIHISTHLHV